MSAENEIQILNLNGKPAFVVLPYGRWLEMSGSEVKHTYIPHEVVGYQIKEGFSLIAAWRRYLKMTQMELAVKVGITQPAIAQIEKPSAKPQLKTLEKIAAAMGIKVEQISKK